MSDRFPLDLFAVADLVKGAFKAKFENPVALIVRRGFSCLALYPVVACTALLFSSSIYAEIPVKDATPDQVVSLTQQNPSSSSSVATGSVNGESAMAELYYQLQILQEEVQNLRGMSESQAHEIKRLKQERLDGYLNLDRRLSELSQRINSVPLVKSSSFGTRPSKIDSLNGGVVSGAVSLDRRDASLPDYTSLPNNTSSTASNTVSADQLSIEKAHYKKARNLLKSKKYESAIQVFNLIVTDFPDGLYATNAYYWLGEIYLVTQDEVKAKNAFSTLLEKFPSGRKVPDTLYKLGALYAKEGNKILSQQFFDKLIKEYPESSATRLANKYINR